jgi:hypothetical protein
VLLPSVSVAMINYNYGRFLAEAIESVLHQEHPPLDVVVVDDGSTDSSREVLQQYEGRITAILTPNRGKGAATNTAVDACRGDVVALIDSDDLMLPSRLRRIAEVYAAHPKAQWVWHDLQHVRRETMEELPPVILQNFTAGPHDHCAAVARGDLPMSAPATSALSWRRTFLASLLPMAPGMRSQDNYLKFLSLGLAPGFVVAERLALQGIHDSNAFTTATGKERRHKQSLRAIDAAPGLGQHGLHALQRRLLADAFLLSRATTSLSPADRGHLLQQLRAVGPAMAPWIALSAGRRGWARFKELKSQRALGTLS